MWEDFGEFMNLRFLFLPGWLVKQQNLNSFEKMLVGLILGFQANGLKCFAQPHWIIDQFGTRDDVFWKSVERLEKLGIITRQGDEWYVNIEELTNENNNKSNNRRSKGQAG